MRQKNTLRYDQTLFREREVFEFTYMPDELNHRDAQIRELARPAVRGGSPASAILRGPPGTGKITTVHRLFAEIEETTQRIVAVYINRQHNQTPFAVSWFESPETNFHFCHRRRIYLIRVSPR